MLCHLPVGLGLGHGREVQHHQQSAPPRVHLDVVETCRCLFEFWVTQYDGEGWWRGGSMEAASLQVDTWGILHWIEMIGRGPQPTFLKSRGILHYSQAYVARALVLLGFAELETGGALVTPFPML